MSKTLEGACYCGAVRFEVALPPRFVAHCHCQNCRAAHSAAFVTWAGFTTPQFSLAEDAPVARYLTETEATRTFCTICGTPLFYESPHYEGEVHVAVPAIRGELPAAKGHAFADRAVPWYPILDTLPRIGGESGDEPLPVPLAVDALVLHTRQPQKAVQFYRQLGLPLVEEQHEESPLHFACDTGLTHFAVYEAAESDTVPHPRHGGATMFGLRVQDLDATLARLHNAGFADGVEPQEVSWGRRAIVLDPDGRPIELNEAPR